MVEVNALVQTQAEEQRLFKRLLASNNVNLGRAGIRSRFEQRKWSWRGAAKIFVQIAGIGKPHGADIGRQHRVSIEAEAYIGLALPILQIMPRTLSRTRK